MTRKKNNRIDVGIISTEPFPFGRAATNRIISSKTVIAESYVVKLYIPRPTESVKNIVNKDFEGKCRNIFFVYTNKITIWPFEKTKIFKLWIILIGLINLCKLILVDKPRVLIIYTSSIQYRLIAVFLKKIAKYDLLIEEDEYPKILKKTKKKFIQKFHLSLYKLVDGMIVMTNELKLYYESIGVKNTFLLPMTVDVERFKGNSNDAKNSDYFIYVGGGGGFQRDSLLNAIRGFHIFSKNEPSYRFLIVGSIEKENLILKEIKEYVEKHKLKNVQFLGAVKSSKIPLLLSNSIGIIMTPQQNYTSGGFPTKLGEFLMSSRPVVATNVSEISHFLNQDNSFLIEPGDDNLIAESLITIVSDRETANEIGLNGRKMAEVAFNAKTYNEAFKSFLKLP